jgi:hypothetical protein
MDDDYQLCFIPTRLWYGIAQREDTRSGGCEFQGMVGMRRSHARVRRESRQGLEGGD